MPRSLNARGRLGCGFGSTASYRSSGKTNSSASPAPALDGLWRALPEVTPGDPALLQRRRRRSRGSSVSLIARCWDAPGEQAQPWAGLSLPRAAAARRGLAPALCSTPSASAPRASAGGDAPWVTSSSGKRLLSSLVSLWDFPLIVGRSKKAGDRLLRRGCQERTRG